MSVRPDYEALPPAPLGPGPAVLALDVGGTTLKTTVVDSTGGVQKVERLPTPRGPQAAEGIIDMLSGQLKRLRATRKDLKLEAVGVSVAGLVDEGRGIGVMASNLGWHDFPFRERAQKALRLPVAFGHDVRAAGRAEYELGSLRDCRNAVVVVIGTGIASAVILDGTALVADGFAGEIGHSIVDPYGPACACGGRGHLETLSSASAIARSYGELSGQTIAGSREVLELALAGDATAQHVWTNAIDALAIGLTQVISLIAPEVIAIGGGLSQAGPQLFGPLGDALDRHLSFQHRPRLVRASLGAHAGLLGTALAARALVRTEPTDDGSQTRNPFPPRYTVSEQSEPQVSSGAAGFATSVRGERHP